MKKKDKYNLISYALNEYGEIFKITYVRTDLSLKFLKQLLKKYKHSSMCEWSYCCYGLYRNCWQEPYFEGNWGMTQKRVDEIILSTIKATRKACKKDKRIGICYEGDDVHVVIVARDLPGHACDYLFTFTNEV